ncbi:MAG: glycosyltransferase family 2 protein [Alphaproteobacteria bacterium]|nr:glycosyltransferase family 2 protein [Alphaproteobacteria bacterium]
MVQISTNPYPSAIALSRLQAKTIADTDLVLASCVQNEALRLPWFLTYYRRLGIDRFLIVDHESRDATASFLDSQEDVLRFCASGSYSDSMHGIDWTNSVTSTYSPNCWVLTVDADEFLVYPNCEEAQIGALASYLESRSATAMRAPLLDMYHDGALRDVRYEAGDDILAAFPYFDHAGYETEIHENFRYIVRGGPRQRVFWDNAELPYPPPHLMKIPFVSPDHASGLAGGSVIGEACGIVQLA